MRLRPERIRAPITLADLPVFVGAFHKLLISPFGMPMIIGRYRHTPVPGYADRNTGMLLEDFQQASFHVALRVSIDQDSARQVSGVGGVGVGPT